MHVKREPSRYDKMLMAYNPEDLLERSQMSTIGQDNDMAKEKPEKLEKPEKVDKSFQPPTPINKNSRATSVEIKPAETKSSVGKLSEQFKTRTKSLLSDYLRDWDKRTNRRFLKSPDNELSSPGIKGGRLGQKPIEEASHAANEETTKHQKEADQDLSNEFRGINRYLVN